MVRGLQYIPAFVAVIQTGSFSAASRQLNVTQSTVSYQIAQLEERMGAALFERIGRGVQPTPLGRRLFDSCERFLGELAAWRTAGSKAGAALPSVLRLASGSSFGRYVLTAILAGEALADTIVDLRFGTDDAVFGMVAEARAELGFVYSIRPSNVLSFAPVYRERLIMIAPPGRFAPSRPTRKWVADANFVTYEESGLVYARWFEEVFDAMPSHIRAVAHCAEIEEVAAFVANGRGLAIVPRHAVARELKARELRELRSPGWPEVTNNVYAVTRVGSVRSDAAAKVLEAIPK
jgi:DNA-binding transcriptional LysR family regulator